MGYGERANKPERTCAALARPQVMSFEQIKREVALLDEQQQAELISYTLQLRYAHDTAYHR